MRVSVEGLAGERGGQTVFSGVSFALGAGDALLVTGPNGSGKSTLLRVLCGLIPASRGAMSWQGSGDQTALAQACHYLGHQNGMKTVLTVAENLRFWRAFLGGGGLGTADALRAVGLDETGHLPFGALSTGQRRRVAIARLLMSSRPVWLLDEPTSGLDAASETMFSDLLDRHRRGGGIVIAATHLPLGLEGVPALDLGAAVPVWDA